MYGDGNWQDYGMRMYNPRIGRFPSVDPITKKYPMLTPFQFASLSHIYSIDIDGLEGVSYFETINVMGVELPIKKVIEMDVYVAVGENQYSESDIKQIQ